MSKFQSEIEEFYFPTTKELVTFLKEDWDYADKDVDKLLSEHYELDTYLDAHEHTITELSLSMADGEQGETQYWLSLKRHSDLIDNYC